MRTLLGVIELVGSLFGARSHWHGFSQCLLHLRLSPPQSVLTHVAGLTPVRPWIISIPEPVRSRFVAPTYYTYSCTRSFLFLVGNHIIRPGEMMFSPVFGTRPTKVLLLAIGT